MGYSSEGSRSTSFNRVFRSSVLAFWVVVTFLPSLPLRAQSLDEVLKKDKSTYQGVPEETVKAWLAVQESLAKSDYTSAQIALKTFDSLTTGVEPYQKTYCQLALQILDDSNKPQESVSSDTPVVQQELQKKIDALNQQIATEEAKKPDIQKKIQDAEHAGIPSNLDTASSAASRRQSAQVDRAAAQRELDAVNSTIRELKSSISSLEYKIGSQQRDAAYAARQKTRDAENAVRTFKRTVISFLRDLNNKNHYGEVVALANLWTVRKGQDQEIVTLSQEALDMQKLAVESTEILRTALQPVEALVQQGRLWEAKQSLDRSSIAIRNQVTDSKKRNMVDRLLSQAVEDLRAKIDVAQNLRDSILTLAEDDALSATPKLEEFRKQYPDYPNYEQDKAKLGRLRIRQAERKLEQKLYAVDKIVEDNPQEARLMVQKLMETSGSEDETFILKAKLVKVTRSWIKKRMLAIQGDLTKARQIYEQYGHAHSEEMNPGWIPSFSISSIFSSDVESLVLAVGLKQKAQERMASLLSEEIDEVTKQELSTQLEIEKITLRSMEKTLSAHHRNRITTMILSGIVLISAIGLGVYVKLKLNRKPASPPPIPSCIAQI